MKTIYAMVTRNCNLKCPHCDIRSETQDDWNEEVFLSILKENPGENLIFGGEPSLHADRIKKAAPYCSGISTNLLELTNELIEIYEDLNVATSWNVSRFTEKQYQKWLSNVDKLRQKPKLLVTLTPDLLRDDSFIDRVRQDFVGRFQSVLFEQLCDATKTQYYYDTVDEWLCEIYKEWDMDLPCDNFASNIWHFNCDDTYTLHPDGTLRFGCPGYTGTKVPTKCLSCEMSATCRPCRLQQHCTAPRKLLSILDSKASGNI